MSGKERMVIKVCPDCGAERQVTQYEFKRSGNTRCRRCSIKRNQITIGKKRAPA